MFEVSAKVSGAGCSRAAKTGAITWSAEFVRSERNLQFGFPGKADEALRSKSNTPSAFSAAGALAAVNVQDLARDELC